MIVVPSDAEAQRLLTTPQQRFVSHAQAVCWTEAARRCPLGASSCRRSGTVRRVRKVDGVQETFPVTDTYEQSDRFRSYSLLAELVS
jgi:hypothetical protein